MVLCGTYKLGIRWMVTNRRKRWCRTWLEIIKLCDYFIVVCNLSAFWLGLNGKLFIKFFIAFSYDIHTYTHNWLLEFFVGILAPLMLYVLHFYMSGGPYGLKSIPNYSLKSISISILLSRNHFLPKKPDERRPKDSFFYAFSFC